MEHRNEPDPRKAALDLIRTSLRQDVTEACKKDDETQARLRTEEAARLEQERKEKAERERKARKEREQREKEAEMKKLYEGTIESRLCAFERIFPGVNVHTASDEAIAAYSSIGIYLITDMMKLGQSGKQAAELIYKKHTRLFERMEDFVILRAAGCLQIMGYSYTNRPDRFTNEWAVKDIIDRIGLWKKLDIGNLFERWERILGAEEYGTITKIWVEIDSTSVTYLNAVIKLLRH